MSDVQDRPADLRIAHQVQVQTGDEDGRDGDDEKCFDLRGRRGVPQQPRTGTGPHRCHGTRAYPARVLLGFFLRIRRRGACAERLPILCVA